MPFINLNSQSTGGIGSYASISPYDSTTSGFYMGRAVLGQNSYWGRYSIAAYPISFDRDMSVSDYGILVNNFDAGFDGAHMRAWIYEADATGMPRTRTWDPGVLTGINTTAGFFSKSATAATLKAGKRYWVASQLVLAPGGNVAINDEDVGSTFYAAVAGTQLDPVASIAWPDGAAIGQSSGFASGLYIDELQSGGWAPGSAAPATLTGDLNDGFYLTSYVTATWIKAVEA
jgi:hypothetical protein